jgi:hypothetical protein
MDNREIKAIKKVSESMEIGNNEVMKSIIERYSPEIAINVMINVATSMLAKALVMTDPSNREHLEKIVIKLTQMKVDEGHAAVESVMAIGRAMSPQGGHYTCQQSPPKKH